MGGTTQRPYPHITPEELENLIRKDEMPMPLYAHLESCTECQDAIERRCKAEDQKVLAKLTSAFAQIDRRRPVSLNAAAALMIFVLVVFCGVLGIVADTYAKENAMATTKWFATEDALNEVCGSETEIRARAAAAGLELPPPPKSADGRPICRE